MTGDESSSLIPASSPGATFPQQGSLDWVSLSKETLSFSFQVLQRLSAEGVDPYTFAIGNVVGNNFRLSATGRKNIESAINSLKSFSAFGEVLRFGFGIETLPRALAKTEQGMVCLALCAALAEFYNEDVAAATLFQLIELSRLPQDMTPSMLEWRSLIKAFQGVFAATEFPLIVQQFIILLTDQPSPMMRHKNVPGLLGTVGIPKDIAKALWAVSQISRGELASIKVIGYTDGAWLAALSVWLLSLHTTITNADGELVYSNAPAGHEQLQIIFDTGSKTSHALDSVATYRRSTGSELILPFSSPKNTQVNYTTGGRLKWEACLSSTFVEAFEKLSRLTTTVGTIIGSAARIFTEYKNGILPGHHTKFSYHSDASYGQGFLLNIARWFPEIIFAQASMRKAVSVNVIEAKSQYEIKMSALQSICTCIDCKETEHDVETDDNEVPMGYCLLVLMETIIILGQVLSCVEIAKDIFPARAGFEAAYLRQYDFRLFSSRNKSDELGILMYLFRTDHASPEGLLLGALELFTGRILPPGNFPISARALAGVCVYMDCLCQLSDEIGTIPVVHVVPGKIEHRQKPYYQIVDRQISSNILYQIPPTAWGEYTELSLLVTPNMDSLEVEYEAKSTGARVIKIGPSKFVSSLREIQHPPRCFLTNCKVREMSQEFYSNSYQKFKSGGRDIGVFCSGSIGRFVALVAHNSRDDETAVVIQRQNCCLPCCVKFAASWAESDVLIIQDSNSYSLVPM
jgi:hypothetical protein